MRIGLTGIFVDDQDHAERFYTEVLVARPTAGRRPPHPRRRLGVPGWRQPSGDPDPGQSVAPVNSGPGA
jgi:hypothetical protein